MDEKSADPPDHSCPPRMMTAGESAMAYSAFKEYFSQGDARTVRNVCKKLEKSEKMVYIWLNRFCWNERIDAANNAALAAFQRETEKQAVLFAARNARRRQKIADESFAIVELSHSKAKEILDCLVVKETTVSADGKHITIKPSPNIRIGDAIRLLVGANVAMNQAEQIFNPRKPGKKTDGSPTPFGMGKDQPAVEIWLDGGDGIPLPLSQMPEVDKPDPNFHPDLDGDMPPGAESPF